MKNILGNIYSSNKFGDFKVVDYENNRKVKVEFLETGYSTTVEFVQITRGDVKDRMKPTVYGVGIIGDKYKISKDSKLLREYITWYSLLMRCYDESYKKKQPTYKNCTTSDNFRYYTYFYEWCNEQIGFKSFDENGKLFQLDKDLLIKDNEVYSEDTCVFLPQEINKVLTNRHNKRGEYLIGVIYNKRLKKFVASMQKGAFKKHLGVFQNEIEAFNAYKVAKEAYLKELAEKWKDRIDIRAYNALMNYEVDIDD